jgi:hypothetical protein
MRSDMFEVIIERPRYGSSWKRKKGRHGEPLRVQEGPTWEPVSRGRGSKGLNENLAPLRRFLERRVGRAWAAVRSEISSILNVRSAVQQHVLEHVKDMVEENAILVDGVPHHPPHLGFRGLEPIVAYRWRGLYVCPRTGILRMAERRGRDRRRQIPDPDVRGVDETHQLRRISGVWYRITLALVPRSGPERARARDVVLGEPLDTISTYRLHALYGELDRYGAAKEQLSSREVRALRGRSKG